VALEKYTLQTGTAVQPCGLYIHKLHGFLGGGSPDGVIGTDGVVEVKSIFAQDTLEEYSKRKDSCLVYNASQKAYRIKTNHDFCH